MPEEYGIDIGAKYCVLAQWKRNLLIGNADGAASRVLTDDKGSASKTRACFANREVFMNNHALTKYSSAYGSSVGGCFEFYPSQTEEDISIFNDFSPCTVGYNGDITFFNVAAGGKPKQPICLYVPSSFYFEYLFYCTLKSNDDLYYSRMKTAMKQKSSGNVYSICYPDYFGKRELQILRNTLRWRDYSNILLLRNMLPAILDYGYYNSRSGAFQNPTRVVFVDSGFSHTSFAVVSFTTDHCVIEYLDSTRSISGRHFLQGMTRVAVGDRMEDFKSNRRVYIRGLDRLEKDVVDLNTPNVGEVQIDLQDVLDDDDADMVEVNVDQFDASCKDVCDAFRQALGRMIHFIETSTSGTVSNVIPLGGNMRVLKLQSILQEEMARFFGGAPARLTQTMNMDECFSVGAALFSHLANNRRIALKQGLVPLFVDDTLASPALKSALHNPTDGAYVVERAEYAVVNVLETEENPRLDEMELDVKASIAEIHAEEGKMIALHMQCSEAESLMIDCDKMRSASTVSDDAAKVVQDFKKACVDRGLWKEARFEPRCEPSCEPCCETNTRNAKWWAKTKGRMEAGCSELKTLKKEFDALNERAMKLIRYTSRAKLSFGEMYELSQELKEWESRFAAAEKEVTNFFEVGLYEIVNRSG